MRAHLMAALMAASFALLTACVMTPTQPDSKGATIQGKPFVDVGYLQFAMNGDAGNKTPVDLSALPAVAEQCHGRLAAPKGGGVNIIADVIGAVAGAAANAIVKGLQNLVKAEVADYSAEEVGRESRGGFYTPALWFQAAHPDTTGDTVTTGDLYSCFVITVTQCDAEKVDKATHQCPTETRQADTRVVIIGQYRLTSEYLQVRPLAGQVRGFAAKRNDDHDASIAATLAFNSTWWDGHQGHTDTATIKVVSATFKPNDQPTGYNLNVEQKDPKSPTGYSFAKWKSLPLYQRPPQSPGSDGTLGVTPTVAEATAPPEYLEALQQLLSAHASDISSALKSALDAIVPSKSASK